MIRFISPKSKIPLQINGVVLNGECNEFYPLIKGIPRFVNSDNYASAFGLQWNTFSHTQLDSHTGHPISKERLERCLGCPVEKLKGKNILEAGCGAGRFTEHLVVSGANVHAFDFSLAVEANKSNIGEKENYQISQASIYEIPYPDNSFEFVICLGVLQHTPDPYRSIQCLWNKLKPGGILVIDHYAYSVSMLTKIFWVYRYLLKRMEPARSKKIVDWLTEVFFPIHWKIRKLFYLQALLSRVSPCLFYYKTFPFLSREQHYELTKLDTYDQLTDIYKHLRTGRQIRKYLEKIGGKNIWINKGGNGVEARVTK
jgi:2-polyprenyl-3-methyl-5-hydroxy-6-metoxy-1,4-benzoquinol methylase